MKKLILLISMAVCLIVSPLTVSGADTSSDNYDEEIVIVSDEEESRHDIIILLGIGILLIGAGTGVYVLMKKKDSLQQTFINSKNSTD